MYPPEGKQEEKYLSSRAGGLKEGIIVMYIIGEALRFVRSEMKRNARAGPRHVSVSNNLNSLEIKQALQGSEFPQSGVKCVSNILFEYIFEYIAEAFFGKWTAFIWPFYPECFTIHAL